METIGSGPTIVGRIASMSRTIVISLVSIIVSTSVFIRFVYDNSVEAKAIALQTQGDQRGMEARIMGQVLSQTILINNQNQEYMRGEFEKMNTKLNRIEFRQKSGE